MLRLHKVRVCTCALFLLGPVAGLRLRMDESYNFPAPNHPPELDDAQFFQNFQTLWNQFQYLNPFSYQPAEIAPDPLEMTIDWSIMEVNPIMQLSILTSAGFQKYCDFGNADVRLGSHFTGSSAPVDGENEGSMFSHLMRRCPAGHVYHKRCEAISNFAKPCLPEHLTTKPVSKLTELLHSQCVGFSFFNFDGFKILIVFVIDSRATLLVKI